MNNVQDIGKDVRYSCPFSEGHSNSDANPSASMEKGTTRAYCFGCGWSGNALTFITELENVSPLQAAQWIKEEYGMVFVPPAEGTISDSLRSQFKEQISAEKSPQMILDEEEIERRKVNWEDAYSRYGNPPQSLMTYMIHRKFKPETLEEWQIGWDKISERFSIPVRNESGHLVGFKGRLPGVPPTNDVPRYLVLGGIEYGFEPYEVSKVVFGLDRINLKKTFTVDDILSDGEHIIVCEGELNCIMMHQHGFKTAVGISGKTLSDDQATLIKKCANKATLIFDEQDDALRAAKKLQWHIPTEIVPQHDKDPADMSRQEVEALLSKSYSSLLHF